MLHRCSRCCYVIPSDDLVTMNGQPYHSKCKTETEYANHPSMKAIRELGEKMEYLLECDPREIVESKLCDDIITLNNKLGKFP